VLARTCCAEKAAGREWWERGRDQSCSLEISDWRIADESDGEVGSAQQFTRSYVISASNTPTGSIARSKFLCSLDRLFSVFKAGKDSLDPVELPHFANRIILVPIGNIPDQPKTSQIQPQTGPLRLVQAMAASETACLIDYVAVVQWKC
jgi:hypothetical protein